MEVGLTGLSEGEKASRSGGHDWPEVAALRQFRLFSGLPQDDLDRIRATMRVRVARAGQEIVGQEIDDTRDVYFLISGQARVSLLSPDGEVVRLAEFQPGEVFGDLAAIDGVARSAAVEVVSACRYAVMSREAFLELVTGTPEMALRMLRVVSSRIRLQNERYFEKTALQLPGRVAKELLRRVRREGAVEVLSPRPSPTELARLIGARRESVSREITRLVRTGVLRRTGEGLVVLDRRALIETATEAQPED